MATAHSDHDEHTIEIDLLCFSSGGEHPSASEPTLFVRDVSRTDRVTMEMEIRAGLLGVLLKEEGQALREFLVFDWKTAQNIAVSVIGIVSDQIF